MQRRRRLRANASFFGGTVKRSSIFTFAMMRMSHWSGRSIETPSASATAVRRAPAASVRWSGFVMTGSARFS